jgi:hypothetical protein
MSSYYSVIRYTPHPITEESINFGLIVFSGNHAQLRVTEDWHRAKAFGHKAPLALKEAVGELTRLYEQNALTEKVIRRFAELWQREVSLTPPRASTLEADALLDKLSDELLRFPSEGAQVIGKRHVVRIAKQGVIDELVRRFKVSPNRARSTLKARAELEGAVKEHVLDIAVFNGRFLGGGVGVSFAISSRPQMEREIDAVAFAISDLRSQAEFKKKPLCVLAHTHGVDRDSVERASKVFQKVGGEFVAESRVPSWSREFVKELPERIFAT